MRWISVRTRQPPLFQPVLLCREGKVESGMRTGEGEWKIYGERVRSVTHWMALPSPPRSIREGSP